MKRFLLPLVVIQAYFALGFVLGINPVQAKEHFKSKREVKSADPFCKTVGRAKDKKTGFKLKSTNKKRFKGFFCRKCKGETESTIDLIDHVTWVDKEGKETEDDIKSPHKVCKASYKTFYYCEGLDANDQPMVKSVESVSRREAKKKLKSTLNRRVKVYKTESKAKKDKYCKEPKEFFYCNGLKEGNPDIVAVKARNRKEAKSKAKQASGKSRIKVYTSESKAKRDRYCKEPKKFYYCTITDGKRVVHTIEAAKRSEAKKQYKQDKSQYKGKFHKKEDKAKSDKLCDETLAQPLTCYFCNPISGEVETIDNVFGQGRLKMKWRNKVKNCADINKKRYIKHALSKSKYQEIVSGLKSKGSSAPIWKYLAKDFRKGKVNMIASSAEEARKKYYRKTNLCELKEIKKATCADVFGGKLGDSVGSAVEIGNYADNPTMAKAVEDYFTKNKILAKEVKPDLKNSSKQKVMGKDSEVITYVVERDGLKCYAKASWLVQAKSCKEIGINVDADNVIVLSDNQGKALPNFRNILADAKSKCEQAQGTWSVSKNNAGAEKLTCKLAQSSCKADVQYRKVEDVHIPFDLSKGLQFDASLSILVHMQLTENDRKCIYDFLVKVKKQYQWGIDGKKYNRCKTSSGQPVGDDKISLKLHLVKMLSDVKSLGCDAVVRHGAKDTKYVEGINFTTKEKCSSKLGGGVSTKQQMRVNGGKWQ